MLIYQRVTTLSRFLSCTETNAKQSDFDGPLVYTNYKAFRKEGAKLFTIEFPIFSDAWITGEFVTGECPYYFYNLTYPRSGAKIVLRADMYYPYDLVRCKEKSNNDYYCDAIFPHDLVAICSLILGARLKAGGRTRVFRSNEDPLGRPFNDSSIREEQAIIELNKIELLNKNSRLMPSVNTSNSNLKNLGLLISLEKFSLDKIVNLIRAARLYQDAIWIGESEPQRAWILLVSSLENCAKAWKNKNYSIVDGLRAAHPDLVEYLQNVGGEEHVNKVAQYLSNYFKLSQKFVDFIIEFLPKSGSNPLLGYKAEEMRDIFKKIYDYRSKALHLGKPFPLPMCDPPNRISRENMEKKFSEKAILGLAYHTVEGSWLPKDVPLNLNAFVNITREVLLQWWKSCLQDDISHIPELSDAHILLRQKPTLILKSEFLQAT